MKKVIVSVLISLLLVSCASMFMQMQGWSTLELPLRGATGNYTVQYIHMAHPQQNSYTVSFQIFAQSSFASTDTLTIEKNVIDREANIGMDAKGYVRGTGNCVLSYVTQDPSVKTLELLIDSKAITLTPDTIRETSYTGKGINATYYQLSFLIKPNFAAALKNMKSMSLTKLNAKLDDLQVAKVRSFFLDIVPLDYPGMKAKTKK